jgi:hypothetical protein
MINLLDQAQRFKLIADMNSENNKARKQWSLRSSEVSGGRMEQYVKERLLGELDNSSVKEMPIVSSINIQKAICDKKATIYKKKPTRRFTETTPEATDTINLIYKDMKLDMKLNKSNKNYIYQDQSIGMIVPKNGKLIARVMKMHQIDVVPSASDPETAEMYILSAFDRTLYIQHDTDKADYDTATGYHGRSVRSTAAEDQSLEIAEKYQFQKYVEKYIVWSKEYHFMMNGLGEVINPATGEMFEQGEDIDISNPIGMLPFFEVAKDKDFEYFVRSSNALTDFTIQFNTQLSDMANNIKMNGYAVGVLKAPSDMMPQNITVGAAMMLKLPTDNPDAETDFEFTSPNSNISEISEAIDKFLNYFVTSEGLGGSVVNSRGDSEKASSGIDRYLMMLSKIEAHLDDYEMFRCAEHDIYEIIKQWQLALAGSDQLMDKYKVSIPVDSELEIDYYKPEMIETESEKLTNIEKKMDLELMSKKQAVMELHGIEDEEKAQDLLDEIKKDNEFNAPELPELPNMIEVDEDDEEES